MAMDWSGLNGTRVAHVALVGCLLLAVAAAFPGFGGHGMLALEPLDAELAKALAELKDEGAAVTRVDRTCGGPVTVDFTLSPEPDSEIRCRISLPSVKAWNGELWGQGVSSYGGSVWGLDEFLKEGAAAVTTDLGTARHLDARGSADKDWPEAVLKDYSWRATHLMTVAAKRFLKAYYGRAQNAALFIGGSCGGRQGMSEAMRFPDDYDGIVSYTPAAMATVSSAQAFNVYRRTHDAEGRELVTPAQLRLLADAAIEYMKDRDDPPYAGYVLSNPFFTEAQIDGLLDLVATKDPQLGTPDLRARLKGIFTGAADAEGRTICHGMLPGVMLGNPHGMSFRRNKLCACNYRVTGADGKTSVRNKDVFTAYPSWAEFEEKAVTHAADINSSATELRGFVNRGGKLIVACGLEDQTTPAPETIAWYEQLAANHGGMEKTKDFCRLFVLPGIAHGGGEGRIGVAGSNVLYRNLLRQWVRKGVAPETYDLDWPKRRLVIPVPPYPERAVRGESGGWMRTRYPENAIRRPHPRYFKTNVIE